MTKQRILYALTWVGCFIFFLAYQKWLGWFLLVAVTTLPLFSLVISLPAMVTARLELITPSAITKGEEASVKVRCICKLPVHLGPNTVLVTQSLSGLQQKHKNGGALPTDHCGALQCTIKKAYICDYLGLFRHHLRRPQPRKMLVRPVAIPMDAPRQLSRFLVGAWQPKPGGGFSENHELRLYRPGDSVQQIHWKLSAKTGKLILREPMQLRRRPLVVGLELRGNPDEMDRKLGRLLWLGEYLLDRNIPFEVQYFSAAGLAYHRITSEQTLQDLIDAMLSCEPADKCFADNHWHFTIGGDANEA